MSDMELRLIALGVAKETAGPKANPDEVLSAADEIFYWLKHGVFDGQESARDDQPR